jgi:hypothetical protein
LADALLDGQVRGEIFSGKDAACAWRPDSHPDPRTPDAYDQDLDFFADEKGFALAA